MWDAIAYLDTCRPRAGVFENVRGLSLAREGELAPLAVLEQELSSRGYATLPLFLNLSTFHNVCRKGPGLHDSHVTFLAGWSLNLEKTPSVWLQRFAAEFLLASLVIAPESQNITCSIG